MTRLCFSFSLVAAIALATACEVGGALPEDPGPGLGPDAGIDEPAPDANDEPLAAPVSGIVRDWATGTALPNAQISTGGLTPPLTVTSDATGAYELDGVPSGSLFVLSALMTGEQFLPTVNARVLYADTPVQRDVYVATNADVVRQYATVGSNRVVGTSFVEATLLKGDGTPRDGVLLADITLADALGNPVGEGPYFFGALGDLDPEITVSTIYDGRARVGFLNVPPGTHTLTVIYPADGDGGGGGGQALPKTATVVGTADTVLLVNVNDKLDGGGGGGGGGGGA